MTRILCVSVVLAVGAHAQPQPVDLDVVYGLMGIESPDQLQIGYVPDNLETFLPDGALEVATYSNDSGNSFMREFTLAVARLETPADDAASDYVETIIEGWTPNPEPNSFRRETASGFVTSGEPPGSERSFSYTRDRDGFRNAVTVRFLPRPAGGSFIQVSWRVIDLSGTALSARAQHNRPVLEGVLPILEAPLDGYQRNLGGGGSSDDYDSRADLTSDLALEDVAEHYHRQITAAGWTAAGESSGDNIATSLWMGHHDDEPLVLVLLIHRTETGLYALKAQVTAVGG